jgi:hypothetical protein
MGFSNNGFNRVVSRVLAVGMSAIFALALVMPGRSLAAQHHILPIDVDSSTADRTDKPVDAPIDLTAFLALVGGSLDLGSLQVTEVDAVGNPLDTGVLFQFDPSPGFDPVVQASGMLVFIMGGDTPAGTSRHYQLWFDLDGACPDCPPPPVVTIPVTVDSLTYENQLTYLVGTPRADYYYHTEGSGLASMIDNDSQDWITFHDIPGSKTAGEYRGIPNLVFKENQSSNSYFHPGFTNAHSNVVNAGPLKVTVFSESDDPANLWQVRWEFYPAYARLTVLNVGTTNEGDYWFLYEGTVGGAMDADDVVVRSYGTQTSAFTYADDWEEVLPEPAWVYFRDLSASRILYLVDDMSDSEIDSFRPMGQTSSSTPQMTVFGFGRVLHHSPNSLVPLMSGTGRTFTIGFGEDYTVADGDIAGAYEPLIVSVGEPNIGATGVGDGGVPARAILHQNYPNPFNPRTLITFTLPATSPMQLDILDLQGRRVANLVDKTMPSGPHSVTFDGGNLPSGMYISRLTTDHGSQERKIMLVR